MNEVSYSRKYSKRWKQFESYLSNKGRQDPSKLEKLYVELMDDLAYAKTNFPESKTTRYLNQLAMRAHQELYKRNTHKRNRIRTFYKITYPKLLYKHRKRILYSFLILLVSALIGALSVHNEEAFVRLILGDQYVNQTISNIEKGDPMGIYSSMKPVPMFFAIAWNNIKVSFLIYAAGVIFSFGSIYLMFSNGLMLGTFQYFFFQEGLLNVSAQTIWLHGTIEIFSIIIAGASGLIIGNSLLFPGTYPRKISFQRGAKEGMKLVAGLIPFFVVAALIESFITRHYQFSSAFNMFVILISIAFILYYFILYPIILKKRSYESSKTPSPTAKAS